MPHGDFFIHLDTMGKGRPKLHIIDPDELRRLYWKEKLNPVEIGKIVGSNFETIRRRMKEYAIPFRSAAIARVQYDRRPFTGTQEAKAYMFGFTVGDLNAYIPGKKSSVTLVVRCHTTHQIQADIFIACFRKYGHIRKSARKRNIYLAVYLELDSFKFLLDKYQLVIPSWLTTEMAWPFVAGYNDAESNFILNQGKARFKLDSYDQHILHWIDNFFRKNNIKSRLRMIGKKGQLRPNGKHFNKDLWRLNVNEAYSLQSFIKSILPYTRHTKRKSDMLLCLRNIKARIKRGSI